MRKFCLYVLAAFMLSSCDNLKKKDSKTDTDDEEVTSKKKKKPLEDDATDEEETPKKKKKVVDEDETPTVQDEDKPVKKDVEYADGWSETDKNKFLDECVPTAEKKVGNPRAKVYCSCFLEKLENKYESYNDANRNMSTTERDKMVAQCNEQ